LLRERVRTLRLGVDERRRLLLDRLLLELVDLLLVLDPLLLRERRLGDLGIL
jgi:hypothetical protein